MFLNFLSLTRAIKILYIFIAVTTSDNDPLCILVNSQIRNFQIYGILHLLAMCVYVIKYVTFVSICIAKPKLAIILVFILQMYVNIM